MQNYANYKRSHFRKWKTFKKTFSQGSNDWSEKKNGKKFLNIYLHSSFSFFVGDFVLKQNREKYSDTNFISLKLDK